MNLALKRALRLRKNSDFQRVRQQGRSVSSRLLVLTWSSNKSEATRVGFVVSKRISKHAVERNYRKRLLSEAIRHLFPDLPAGVDIVFTARNQIVTADLRTLEQDMRLLLQRARLPAASAGANNTPAGSE